MDYSTNSWLFDIESTTNFDDLAKLLEEIAKSLGFEYFAYGRRTAIPFSNPHVSMISNYPTAWTARYSEAQYIKIDPSIITSRRLMRPLVWSEKIFAQTSKLWNEAHDYGLKFGCAQYVIDCYGNHGMLTLARGHELISSGELREKSERIHWLAAITHERHSLIHGLSQEMPNIPNLSSREIEILRWSADGKIASDIAIILGISPNTVEFHLKNSMLKLNSSNKVSAIAKAITYGILSS